MSPRFELNPNGLPSNEGHLIAVKREDKSSPNFPSGNFS